MPNVVFIVSDDVGLGDIQAMGGLVATPNIDRLISQGMNFTDAHTSAAQCHPSRFSIITGSNPFRTGHRYGFDAPVNNNLISGGQTWRTMGDVMKGVTDESGASLYNTSFIGKMHFGLVPLSQHGYDHVYGLPTGYQHPENMIVDGNAELITDENGTALSDGLVAGVNVLDEEIGPLSAVMTSQARSFIESQVAADRPFFIHYNTLSIHAPHRPPLTFTTYDGTEVIVRHATDLTPEGKRLSHAAATVVELDQQVGYILDTLEAEGVADDTLVVFTSDNGPAFGLPEARHLMPNGHFSTGYLPDSNGDLQPLRAGKFDMYEGGTRVPFVARWGDGTAEGSLIPAGTTNDKLISVNDLMASLYDLTGQAIESNQAMDSLSILPTLFDPNQSVRSGMYFHSSGASENHLTGAWRMDDTEGEWTLLFETLEPDYRGFFLLRAPENLAAAELYNLADDPGQVNNLLPASIQIDANEMPSLDDLAAITDDGMRQRVATMIDSFFAHWRQGDPRSTPAVDYSLAQNQTSIPVLGLTGDTNRDGVVDITDLNNVRNNFGVTGSFVSGDTNADGVVDISDLNNVRNNFGATAIPEPSAMSLGVLALLGFVALRRRVN